MKNKLYIGTSGWSYYHWKETFYPKELPTKKWLEYYSEYFDTVELNTTFYHLPLKSTVKNWNEKVPSNFLFSVKGSRYITHLKRLLDCQESLNLFYESIKSLNQKQGPILFQLPPSFKMDVERLDQFLKILDKKYRYVFEFRNDTWYEEEVYKILKKRKVALCISDLNGKKSPEVITTDFTYLRLHGPKKAYKGSYGNQLKDWEKKFSQWLDEGITIYCYFDNDEKAYAINDALKIKNMFLK